MSDHWTVGIGDPTPFGWVTVFAYVATAGLCAAASRKSPCQLSSTKHSDRGFWLGVTVVFAFLALNKQLDLQSLLTEVGRNAAKAEGLYGNRRLYQATFVIFLGFAGFAILLRFLWQLRNRPAAVKVALLGLTFTVVFVLVRAASFHHVDVWLGSDVFSVKWNWLIEFTGIGTVAAAALWSLAKSTSAA